MFFTSQIDEIIADERKAFRLYRVWLVIIIAIGAISIAYLIYKKLYTDLGPTLSSLFILFLSKPPFSEMMKRKEKIQTLVSLKRMAMAASPDSKEAVEIEKLIVKNFQYMLKG